MIVRVRLSFQIGDDFATSILGNSQERLSSDVVCREFRMQLFVQVWQHVGLTIGMTLPHSAV